MFMNNLYFKQFCSALIKLHCMCGSLCRDNACLKSGGRSLTQLHDCVHVHRAFQMIWTDSFKNRRHMRKTVPFKNSK